MSDPDFVDVSALPLVADEMWYYGAQNGAPPDERWQPINLAAIPDEPPTRPELGLVGLAYRGKRHVFSGPQESAKTLCAYVLGLQVLRLGGLFCLLDFEMGRWDARNRLRELGATQDELAQIIYFEPDGKMPDRVPTQVIDLVGGRDAIVLIDAAAGAFAFEELDDNKRMDVEKFGARYVEPFRKAGIATLVLDHVVKSSEARGNYAIGSERKVGATDVHLGFSVVHPIKRGSTGVYKITTHKDRGGFLKRGKLCEFELHSDPDTHAISWQFNAATETDEEHPFRPTHLMEKVSIFLERQLEAVTVRTVKAANLGKDEYVREALSVLVDEGFVKVTQGPKRSLLHECVMAYREANDEVALSESRVSPSESREAEFASESVSPPYYVGDSLNRTTAGTDLSESRSLLDEDDGIPF